MWEFLEEGGGGLGEVAEEEGWGFDEEVAVLNIHFIIF